MLLMLAGMATASAETKTLTYLSWGNAHFEAMIKGRFAEFERLHPDVKMKWVDVKGPDWPGYYQTQVIAGTAPDIIQVQGSLWLEYASQGGLVDLTPYLKKDNLLPRFEPAIMETYKYKDKYYLVPYGMYKTMLFYNKKHFAEAGISQPPKNFDELMDDATKLSAHGHAGYTGLNFDWMYWPLFASKGVKLLNDDGTKAAFNTPVAVSTLETLAAKTASGAIDKSAWTGRYFEILEPFGQQRVSMLYAHSPAFLWLGSQDWVNKDTLGMVNFPSGMATPDNHGLAISRSSKYPELAWEFIKLTTNDQFAEQYVREGKMLSGNVAANKKMLAQFTTESPLLADMLKLQTEDWDKLVGVWPNAKDGLVKNAVFAEIQNAVLGRKPAKDALADAEQKVNQILAR
jgi:ABC-type glycerol-3-phosphate transport system substrate-binding protein